MNRQKIEVGICDTILVRTSWIEYTGPAKWLIYPATICQYKKSTSYTKKTTDFLLFLTINALLARRIVT